MPIMENHPDSPETKPKRSPWWGVQRFVVCIGILGVFWVIFGQIVPRVAFKEALPAIEADTADEPSAEIIEDAPSPHTDEPSTTMPQPAAEQAQTPAPALPESPAPPAPLVDDTRLVKLEEKLIAQENEIAALKTALQAQATTTQTKVESTLSALIVYGQLKETVMRGEPYIAPLNQLKNLTLNNAQAQSTLAALAAYAEKGVATPARLSTPFPALITDALLARTDSRYAHSMSKLFSIRKVGEQPGIDDEAVLARAEAQLARDDVKAALDSIAQLSPPVKDVMKPWVQNAEQMLSARTQLDALQRALAQDHASE